MTAKKPTVGICNLCKKKRTLIRSHIFPESFYRKIYPLTGPRKFITTSTNEKAPIELKQKGIREPLMCSHCDGKIIGRYETYIANLLYNHSGCTPVKCGNSIHLNNVDFSLFRLFQLSLLWRFHIATSPGFSNFHIPKHGDTIREMLLNGVPGDQFFFPCILLRPKEASTALENGLFCPHVTPSDPFSTCRVTAAGFVWVWFLTENSSSNPFSKASVSPSNEMDILMPVNLLSLIGTEIAELYEATMRKSNASKLSKWGFE